MKYLTILKFFTNQDQIRNNKNKVMSKTCLKVTFVDRSSTSQPEDGELWLCAITKDTAPGEKKGCFLCQPQYKIDPNAMIYLVFDSFDLKLDNKNAIIIPKIQTSKYWVLSLPDKRRIKDEQDPNSIIVDLTNSLVKN